MLQAFFAFVVKELLDDFLRHFVFDAGVFYLRNCAAGKDELHFVGSDEQDDGVVLDRADGAVDAADGADARADLKACEHVFDLLVAAALRDDHDGEHRNHEDDQQAVAAEKAGETGGKTAAHIVKNLYPSIKSQIQSIVSCKQRQDLRLCQICKNSLSRRCDRAFLQKT